MYDATVNENLTIDLVEVESVTAPALPWWLIKLGDGVVAAWSWFKSWF